MDSKWQDVLDRFHYGIYLVTISVGKQYNGMIASWVTQCSHEPPLIAVAVRKNRLSHEQILNSGAFCINVLPKEAAGMIKHFKISDWQKKFSGIQYRLSQGGLPVVEDAIGYLDCSLDSHIPLGDHTLFIGRIREGGLRAAAGRETLSTADYGGAYRGDR